MFPAHAPAEGVVRGDVAALASEIVYAGVVEAEVAFKLALEVPGLLGGFGDESAAIVGVNAGSGAALVEVVEPQSDVEIGRGKDAKRFEQPPVSANAETESLR